MSRKRRPRKRIPQTSKTQTSKTHITDLENADLEKKKGKDKLRDLNSIRSRTKVVFLCLCHVVFSLSLFARSAFSKSAFSRTQKKQRPRKHRPVTNTLKNNSLCSRAYYGRNEVKFLISSFLFLLLFAVLFPFFSNLFPISKSR